MYRQSENGGQVVSMAMAAGTHRPGRLRKRDAQSERDGDLIRGLRYALPASVLLWLVIFGLAASVFAGN
jgi:hypothetical protein